MITFRTGELIKLLHGVPVRFAAIHENHPSYDLVTPVGQYGPMGVFFFFQNSAQFGSNGGSWYTYVKF